MISQFSCRKWHFSFFPKWHCVFPLSFLHIPHGSGFCLLPSIFYSTTRLIFLKQCFGHSLIQNCSVAPHCLPLISIYLIHQRTSSNAFNSPVNIFLIFSAKVSISALDFLFLWHRTQHVLPYMKLQMNISHQWKC